jgi:hypothetical protein
LVLVLLLVLTAIAASPGEAPAESLLAVPEVLAIAFVVSGGAVGPAIAAAWLPAFAAGTALWAVGRARPWARRRLAWAAAGAAVGLLCWLRLFPLGTTDRSPLDLLPADRLLLGPAFLLAGAAAGQAFRSAMAAVGPFLGLDEEEEAEGAD